jgi:hypothetical protein
MALISVMFLFLFAALNGFLLPLLTRFIPEAALFWLAWGWIIFLLLILSVISMILNGLGIRKSEIVLGEEGMLIKHTLWRTTSIQKVTDVKISKSGKVTVEGLSADGKRIRRTFSRTFGLAKKWEDFKKELQNFVTPSKEQQSQG